MEIVNMEARTYEAMMEWFEQFTQRVDALSQKQGGREKKKWLDSQDICMVLNISKRTLQTLRDSGRLAIYANQPDVYYKPEDVQRLITDTGNGNGKGTGHE